MRVRVDQSWEFTKSERVRVYQKWTCESLPNLRESLPKVSVWEFTKTEFTKSVWEFTKTERAFTKREYVRVHQNWERVYQKWVWEFTKTEKEFTKSERAFTKSEYVRVHQKWVCESHQNWEFTKSECVYPNKTWHPCFWKIYRNAFLSHSCQIDLAPPVSEHLAKETSSEPSNKTGNTKSGVSCLCMLTGWSWPVHQSQRHIHCSYLVEWLDVLHPLLVLQCVLLVLLVVLGELSKWLHVLTLVFHVLQGQQNITVMS